MRARSNIGPVCFLVVAGMVTASALFAQAADHVSTQLQDAAKEISAGQLRQAEKNLDSVLSLNPGDYRALDLLGVVNVLQHQNANAEKLFGEVVEAKPNFAPGHAHLGLLYLRMNRPQDALPELRQALRIDHGRVDAAQALVHILLDEAQSAQQDHNFDDALGLLIEARKYEPDNADVLYEFGVVALKRSLIDDAIEAFQQVLKQRGNDSLAMFYLGYALMDRSRFDDARLQFAQYVKLRPDDPSGYGALGMALAGLGRSAEARAQFERSIALDPRRSESYYQLGLVDLSLGDYDQAALDLQKVLENKPNDGDALTALGRVEFEQGHYPKALAYLKQAVGQEASLQEAHYYLGLTLARMGRKQESSEQLEIATQLDEERKERGRRVLRLPGDSPSPK